MNVFVMRIYDAINVNIHKDGFCLFLDNTIQSGKYWMVVTYCKKWLIYEAIHVNIYKDGFFSNTI